MSDTNNVLFGVTVTSLVACAALGTYVKKQQDALNQANAELTSANDRILVLDSGAARSANALGSHDAVKAAGDVASVPMAEIEVNAHQSGTVVTGVNVTTTLAGGQKHSGLASTTHAPAPAQKPAQDANTEVKSVTTLPCPWVGTTERLSLEDSYGSIRVPWGSATFTARDEKPWGYEVLPKKLSIGTVLATREDGTHRIYSSLDLEVEGNHYRLPISDARWTESLPDPQWRWSPKLYLGAAAGWPIYGNRAIGGALGSLSLASYGATETNPRWAFLLLGLAFTSERTPALAFSPLTWNAGEKLPLLDSLYLGPSFFVEASGRSSLLVSLQAKL